MKPLSLLTVSQMRQTEELAMQSGVAGEVLMARAGQAVAQAIMQRWSPRLTLILCGPGNNGGDGLVLAQCLQAAAWPVRVAVMPSASPIAEGFERVPLVPESLQGVGLVVDALFGIGLSRPLSGDAAVMLQAVAQSTVPVVAVDVPSGLFGDTGADGGAARAELTVTFHRKKLAHVLMPGRALCGEVVVADIGLESFDSSQGHPPVLENQAQVWRHVWPQASVLAHKFERGHALVYGGAVMTGASRLSAKAAARVGAGLTSLVVPQAVWPVYASALGSIMVQPLDGVDSTTQAAQLQTILKDSRITAVLLGPGAARGLIGGVRPLVDVVLASGRPVVLDADALSAFETDPEHLFAAIKASPRPVVMTPHQGEFARLFPGAQGLSPADKLSRARWAAQQSGAIVVLKGADTVVVSPEGAALVNTNAPPTLATAGSGDVLAGLIVGLLAQGMPALSAAASAVWLHGAAAQQFGPGLIADDLPEQIPGVLRQLLAVN